MARYVSYTGIEDQIKKDRTAIIDILQYIGARRFKILVRAAKDPAKPLQWTNMAMSFSGVSGYPFHAFAKRYMPEKYDAWISQGDEE
jgi:hypothetical protein